MDSEPVGGVLPSWAESVSSTWLVMFHLPCVLESTWSQNLRERLAILSCLLRKVYVCEEWVASCAGIPPSMKSEQVEELLKCWRRNWNVLLGLKWSE